MRNTTSTLVRILGNAAISLIGLALVLAASPMVSAQTVDALALVGHHEYQCGTLNLTSGVFTETGSLPMGIYSGVAGLGANLYLNNSGELALLNIQNCTYTNVGFANIAYLGGTTAALYAIGGGIVYSINPATGAATELGSTGLSCSVSTAVAADEPATTMEYEHDFVDVFFDFICDNGSGSILYGVSITGVQGFRVNEIGPTGVSSIEALVFVGNTLYATNAAGEEYTINTSTGAATLVASTTQPITAMGVPASALSTLHTFTGGLDGGSPFAGLVVDASGDLYGSTGAGGTGACAQP